MISHCQVGKDACRVYYKSKYEPDSGIVSSHIRELLRYWRHIFDNETRQLVIA